MLDSSQRTFRFAVIVSAAVVAVSAVWLAKSLGGPHVTTIFDDLIESAVPFAAAGACFFAARLDRGRGRLAWALLGASAASWGAGQVVWSIYELGLGRSVPFPSFANLGYLAAIPLASAALLSFPGAHVRGMTRARSALDAVIVAGSLFLVSWVIVLGPLFRSNSGSVFEHAISVAYPAGDVVVATLVIIAARRAHPRARAALALVGLGLVAMAIADGGFTYLTTIKGYTTGNLIDLGWIVGYTFIGLGALAARPAPHVQDEPEGTRIGGILLIYCPLLIGIFVGGRAVLTRSSDHILVWSGLGVVGAVIVRQLVALLDNTRLLSERKRAEDALNDFVGVVAHDLKSPMTAAMGFTEVLVTNWESIEEARRLELAGRIGSSLGRLSDLVDDVLQLARIEAGSFDGELGPFDIGDVVRMAVEESRVSSGRTIRFQIDESLPSAYGNGARTWRVLTNLLSNAMKYSPDESPIDVRATARDGHVELQVRDSGTGISHAELDQLFQRFSRLAGASDGGATGTGLGLYICKALIESQGGRIWVESTPGVGSTFAFSLKASS